MCVYIDRDAICINKICLCDIFLYTIYFFDRLPLMLRNL